MTLSFVPDVCDELKPSPRGLLTPGLVPPGDQAEHPRPLDTTLQPQGAQGWEWLPGLARIFMCLPLPRVGPRRTAGRGCKEPSRVTSHKAVLVLESPVTSLAWEE